MVVFLVVVGLVVDAVVPSEFVGDVVPGSITGSDEPVVIIFTGGTSMGSVGIVMRVL